MRTACSDVALLPSIVATLFQGVLGSMMWIRGQHLCFSWPAFVPTPIFRPGVCPISAFC